MATRVLFWRLPQTGPCHARTFITLPFSGASATRKQYNESCIFPYTRDQIYSVVSDVDRYHEFVPMCIASTVFHDTKQVIQKSGKQHEKVQAELVVGYPPFREQYTSVVTMERPHIVIAEAAPGSGMFKHMKTVWEFEEHTQGTAPMNPFMKGKGDQTLVKFAIDFEFSSILHAQAATLAFDRMAKSNLAAYLERCRVLFGK